MIYLEFTADPDSSLLRRAASCPASLSVIEVWWTF